MSENADLITIQEEYTEDCLATEADLFVIVKGSSFFTGQSAFRKAKEVNVLVFELGQVGVNEEDVHLQDVAADVETGLFSSSSSAQYLLRIHCSAMEKLSEILAVITAQKNVNLHGINWLYSDSEEIRATWLEKCIRRANSRAEKIAKELGVPILGIRKYSETHMGKEAVKIYSLAEIFVPSMSRVRAAAAARAPGEGGLGFSLNHAKKAGLSVLIEYRVGDRKTST